MAGSIIPLPRARSSRYDGRLASESAIKPFILDYDRNNLRLSVVDKGFLIWLAVKDQNELLSMLELPTD
jgi:hypothetical protein